MKFALAFDEPGEGPLCVVSQLNDILALLDAGRLAAVGIDIPIGLPETGPRACDVEAMKLVGARYISVVPAPPRAALGARTYEEACARSQTACGEAMSQLTYAILPKVEALDAVMTPERQAQLVEVHPEVSFTVLAGRPMAHHKATREGRAERLAVLRTVFSDVDKHADELLAGTQPDDILDAFVATWSARRWLTGTYQRLGGEVDARGLRMEIIA